MIYSVKGDPSRAVITLKDGDVDGISGDFATNLTASSTAILSIVTSPLAAPCYHSSISSHYHFFGDLSEVFVPPNPPRDERTAKIREKKHELLFGSPKGQHPTQM